MGSIEKGQTFKEDIRLWNGVAGTDTRDSSDAYTLTLNKVDWPGVDVLAVYGGGVNRTKATLTSALTGVGAVNKVRFFLSPGEWAITDDLTITSNVTLYVPPGASLAVTAAKTLTIEGPIEAGSYQIFSGAGTITFTNGFSALLSWFSNLATAVSNIAAVEGTLTIDTDDTMTSNITFPATLSIIGMKSQLITTTGYTLTINGPFEAGPYQIFSGSGTAAIGKYFKEVFPEWWGAVGDGSTDDTTAIQAALDAVGTFGGGIVRLGLKAYACTDVEIESYEGIVGTKLGAPRYSTAAGAAVITDTIMKLKATGAILVTPVAQQDGITIEGIHFQGLGAGTAGVGIHFKDVDFSVVRQCTFDNFSDQGILEDAGTANKFEDLHLVNCVLDRTQADHVGAIQIAGVDMHLNRIEATISHTEVSDANLYLCGILIEGSTSGVNFIENCIGEISDVGIRIEGTLNRIVNCRADLNWGHGFQVTGSRNQFTNCSSISNSADTTNTYDGWDVSSAGSGNTFVNCDAVSRAADGWVHRYGFVDAVESMTAITTKNRYVGCHSILHGTGAFLQDGNAERGALIDFPMGPPILATNLDTTPSVEQIRFLRFDYNAGTNVTDFNDGVEGQILHLLSYANSNVTITYDAAKIKTTNGANLNLLVGKIYSFIHYNGIWHQLGDQEYAVDTTGAGAGADGTISSRNANALGECDGFIKAYKNDGTLVYVPYWEDITP